MSTVLSTPGQVTIPPSYLDIGMGGYFEGLGGCGRFWLHKAQMNQISYDIGRNDPIQDVAINDHCETSILKLTLSVIVKNHVSVALFV